MGNPISLKPLMFLVLIQQELVMPLMQDFFMVILTGENIKKMAIKGNYVASRCVTEQVQQMAFQILAKLENIY